VLTDDKLKAIEERVKATIDDAVEFATDAPDPKPDEAVSDLYA
jgi:TPP-dependent pyruvate/acetoin dehydrogenase alpha subunit